MTARSTVPILSRGYLVGVLGLAMFVAASMLTPTPSSAQVIDVGIDEGIDYRVVQEPARLENGDDVEVLELFWYGCPHCYFLEEPIQQWLTTKPAGVSFRRMPAAAAQRWVPHAKAFYAAEMLGQLDKLHEPLFKALHTERRKIFTEQEIIAFAAEQGIDEEAFRKAYNSFPVDMKVRKSGDLVRRYNIDGVPAIVVNGKFVTSATQTGSTAKMFEVVNQLVAEETKANSASNAAAFSEAESAPESSPKEGSKTE